MKSEEFGYRKLVVWRNAYELRRMIFETTKDFPKVEIRRVSQMRDAARSVKQNIQEGYSKSLAGYINCLGISAGSLRELRGDIEDCFDDGLITEEQFSKLNELSGKTEYLFKRLLQSLNRKRQVESGQAIPY